MSDHILPLLNSDLRKIRLAPDLLEHNRFSTVWKVLRNYFASTVVARARSYRKSTQSNEYSSKQAFQTRQTMSVYRIIVAHSRNSSCNGKPAVRSACVIELRVSVIVNRQKQDKECRYNVKLKGFYITVVAVENQCVVHIPSVCL